MIRFACSNCRRLISVDEKHSGKKGKCPKCRGDVVVPERSTIIEFSCGSCGRKISVPERQGGKKGACPKCKNPVAVPSLKKVPAESDTSIPPTTDEDIDRESLEEYEEPEGVDRRLIFLIAAVAVISGGALGLIFLVVVLQPFWPPQNVALLIISIAIVSFVMVVLYFGRARIIKRKFRKVEEKNIASCKDGEMVKIIGELKYAEEPLFAPLSKRKCAVYKIIVEKFPIPPRGGSHPRWREIINDKKCTPFFIKNGSEYALIKSVPCELLLSKDANYPSRTFHEIPPFLEDYINKFGKKSERQTPIFGRTFKQMRYKESVLAERAMVAVLGKGKWINVNELEILDTSEIGKAERLLVIEQRDGHKLYISDEPGIVLN